VRLYIGTSGWQYRDWRGSFYPTDIPQRLWLPYYAKRFATVEVNNSFYRLPPRERFAAWAAATPGDFVVVPKASRYLSHIKRLREPQEPVGRFVDSVRGLGRKLGPVLVQLPPTMQADASRLEEALSEFPRDIRVAVEFRHDSWWTDEVRAVLERHNAACCWAERRGRWISALWRPAAWGYVRFHEGDTTWPCYRRETLLRRLHDIAEVHGGDDVYVFFNNDPRCCAVANAVELAELAAVDGHEVTRVPRADEVRVVEPAAAGTGQQ
jgi:uncharacterized protein YecE (DUF72 family)